MAPTFSVNILTADRQVFEGEAESLVAPAAMGYVGILAHHAPLITTLGEGKIMIRGAQGAMTSFDCRGGGFLEVSANKAVILAGSAEPRQ